MFGTLTGNIGQNLTGLKQYPILVILLLTNLYFNFIKDHIKRIIEIAFKFILLYFTAHTIYYMVFVGLHNSELGTCAHNCDDNIMMGYYDFRVNPVQAFLSTLYRVKPESEFHLFTNCVINNDNGNNVDDNKGERIVNLTWNSDLEGICNNYLKNRLGIFRYDPPKENFVTYMDYQKEANAFNCYTESDTGFHSCCMGTMDEDNNLSCKQNADRLDHTMVNIIVHHPYIRIIKNMIRLSFGQEPNTGECKTIYNCMTSFISALWNDMNYLNQFTLSFIIRLHY